jgi:hypothetical protein
MAKQMRKAKKTIPASRARRKLPARRRAAPAKPAAKPRKKRPMLKQAFVANHHRPDAFEVGLRRYAQYRDLGIAAATGGLARAHVIKMVPPCDPAEVSKRHYHDVDFQMVYVLKGWIKGEYEGTRAPAW